MLLKTKYEVGEIPHSEHPCPQRKRESWLCLNGEWLIEKQNKNGEILYQGEILVPFSPETPLSRVSEKFVLNEDETLVYTRGFYMEETLLQGTAVLQFGAVDSECEVYLNGVKVGEHKGGFTPFGLDISEAIKSGENQIKIVCKDLALINGGARGKQSKNRGGIWYTPQSGIWQTVWIETMPKNHIKNLKILPNAYDKTVKISAETDGKMQITVFDGETQILQSAFEKEITLEYNFELWSPENPKLYSFVLQNEDGDKISSYFGVRSFGMAKDEKGIARLTLNGKPYFFNGLLDQGYWADGMLTYPSDQAAIDELTTLKAMGFNTLRKHIKLEPMRWYYHCDRLGIVVWQDFVNGGGEYKFTHIAAFPFLGFHHRDDDYKYFARENEGGRVEFKQSVDETIDTLYNCTCIGVWVPFNEGWGQFNSAYFTEYIKAKDSSRIIDSVSGWHDQGVGKTELKSLHTYYTPLKVPKDTRPVVLSEFGGYSLKIEGHTFHEKEFGYKTFKTQQELKTALQTLYLKKLKPLIAKGLCAAIYTQVSDVEDEINGLFTYDRAVTKISVDDMKAINDEIMNEANKIK